MSHVLLPTSSPLSQGARDLRYLLSRGYPRRSAITFVGNHYQLDDQDRHILYRAVFPRKLALELRAKKVRPRQISNQTLVIDGYNCFITLESGLQGKTMVLGDDGFIRDVSGVFRRFKPSLLTNRAWELMVKVLKRYRPKEVLFILDQPYSQSGIFCQQIRQWLQKSGLEGNCNTLSLREKQFSSLEGIKVSADSVIIDNSDQVFDLAGHIILRILRIKPLRFLRS